MLKHFAVLTLICCAAVGPAVAENPWGPECKTLNECLERVRQTKACQQSDPDCGVPFATDGIGIEFEKFGNAAVGPLLQIMQSGTPAAAEKAAELAHSAMFSDEYQVTEEDRQIIFGAWRRGIGRNALLASSFATPDFVREVIAILKSSESPNPFVANTFSNFREPDFEKEPPDGITATITKDIECSYGVSCNPYFAKAQLEWLSGNASLNARLAEKLGEVLDNPKLDVETKLLALKGFQPSEYGNKADTIRSFAIPVLARQMQSASPQLQFEAARLLAMLDDTSAVAPLVAVAEDRNSTKRKDALISLAGMAGSVMPYLPRLVELLHDSDPDIRRHVVVLLGETRNPTVIDHLMEQIDEKDWLVTFSAVRALQNMPADRAEPALRKVAQDYWHPIVKAAATQTLSRDPNLAQYPKNEADAVKFANAVVTAGDSASYDRQDYEITQWCKARFERDGYRFVPDYITGPEVVKEMEDASMYNAKHFVSLLTRLAEMKIAVKVPQQLTLGDWTFAGTPAYQRVEGTELVQGTGQLVAQRKDGTPQVILHRNIAAVLLWNGKPYAVSGGTDSYDRGDGFIYEIGNAFGTAWTAKPILRLTGTPAMWLSKTEDIEGKPVSRPADWHPVWLAPDQTIGVLANGGVMLIRNDGKPEWVGCAEPSFP